MTNNTQLLPCPFCGVDLSDLDSSHTASCYFTLAEMLNNLPPSAINREFFQRSDEAWNTRAAPAEDVRAVVEGPVAWVVNWADSGEKYCVVEPGWRAERLLNDPDFKATPLYRHPQREGDHE